ncbi:hypothetical protein [Massilia aerilata]|uniref:Uncharacterized protein n=1 Tax=Massilia aerilata TaxID=453817 RepID=A0ABW0S692_9BURK
MQTSRCAARRRRSSGADPTDRLGGTKPGSQRQRQRQHAQHLAAEGVA